MIQTIYTGLKIENKISAIGCVDYSLILNEIMLRETRNKNIVELCSELGFENVLVVVILIDHARVLEDLEPRINVCTLRRIENQAHYPITVYANVLPEHIPPKEFTRRKVIHLVDDNRALKLMSKRRLRTYSEYNIEISTTSWK